MLRRFCLFALLFPAGVTGAAEPRAMLVLAEDTLGAHAALQQKLPLKWTIDGAGVATAVGVSLDEAFKVTLRLAEAEGAAGRTLTVEGVWLKKSWVHLAAITLELDGDHATVLGRDLEPAAVHTAFLERFDPKWIVLQRGKQPLETVLIDDTVDGVVVHSNGKGVELRIELDSAEARPFLHDERCTSNWHAPNKHLQQPLRLRVPDEKVSARLQLLPGAALALAKAHFPDGRRAALVVTDHADQSSARTLDALAAGLSRHHLTITKALFAHGADRPQLEDPRVLKLADELSAAGSEIVPHSATPRPDARPVTAAALDRFERWHTRTWIDHQPETNCEAFGDQGFHTGGKFGIADLLAAHQYQYVWAEDDAPAGDLNLLSPRHLDHRAPTVWPIGRLDLGGPDGLWMFRTVWAFIEARRFFSMYSPAHLDRLELERGLHIAHTYLETYHPKRTKFGLRNLLVPADSKQTPGGPGEVKLDPRFDALLGDLEARQARGSLWMPTLAALGDRLRAESDVTVTLLADGSVRLHAAQPVAGATFVVARPNLGVQLDGKAPRGLKTEGASTIFWDDLPAGDTTLQLTTAGGAPLPFSQKAARLADVEHP